MPPRDGRRRGRTAWRIEGTLREFAPFKPINLWFDYPIHQPDTTGVLGDLATDGETPAWQPKKGWKKINAAKSEKQSDNWETLVKGFETLNVNGEATISELMEYSGMSRNAVKKWVDHQPGIERDVRGRIKRTAEGQDWGCQGVIQSVNDSDR